MKQNLLPKLLPLILFVFCCNNPLSAQDQAPVNPQAQEFFTEATTAFGQNNFEQALAALDKLESVSPGNHAAQNLRGAIYVRQRRLPEAEAIFRGMYEQNEENLTAAFNLGEALFVQKRYAEAKPYFVKFNTQGSNALARLKILLCDLLGGREDEARAEIDKLMPSATHPLYYFAHAAVHFKNGKEDQARDYLQAAFSIYPGGVNATFSDSMIEVGWIKAEDLTIEGDLQSPTMESLTDRSSQDTITPSFESVLPEF